jgi:hypothetical protein
MTGIILFPVKLLGLAAAGVAVGVGWKVGSYLGDVVIGERELKLPQVLDRFRKDDSPEPIWKRKFSRVSEEE